jgi:hemerythrin-like metal-binding protein
MSRLSVPRLGHALIDRQHRRIRETALAFIAAIRHSSGRRELTALLHATERNFASEGRLMRASRYPHGAGHRALHRSILGEMKDLREILRRGQMPHQLLISRAVDWLAHHADEADRALVGHLARRKKQ